MTILFMGVRETTPFKVALATTTSMQMTETMPYSQEQMMIMQMGVKEMMSYTHRTEMTY